jgi:parallel beta-helix repeat protein
MGFTDVHLLPYTLVKVPSLNTSFTKKMKNQGFHISRLSLQTSLTALLLVAGCSTLILTQLKAGAAPTLTAQVPANGTVIYVNSATGKDTAANGTIAAPYKTITFALSKATAGTVVQVAPGNYSKDSGETFPLVLNSGVTLQGNESNKGEGILISGGGYYTSRTFARQDITLLANNSTIITGLTFTNPNSRGTAVWVESSNPVIKDSTFINSVREGIFVTGTGNPQIENNVFLKNKGNGISVTKSAQGVIRGNLFQDTGFGVAIGGSSTPLLESNNITQNTDGLFISETAKPILRKNSIRGNKRDGIVATISAVPDLGTSENPGGNLIRDNARYDLNNATKAGKIVAIGNDINEKRIFGAVDFVAAKVTTPPDNNTGNTGNTGNTAFKDVQTGYWAKAYIEALAAKNIIAGFPDGSFKPNEPVTRAQFAAIINKAFKPSATRQAITFNDVKSNYWAYSAIQTASSSPFLSGYPDLTFKPEQQIPRVQALVALANGLGLTANGQTVINFYTDASQIPSYAVGPVAAATSRQLVINYPTVKELAPKRQATRAEIAAFVYQALVNAGRVQAINSPYLVTGK